MIPYTECHQSHWYRGESDSVVAIECITGSILSVGLHPANESRRYYVTPSLICGAQA